MSDAYQLIERIESGDPSAAEQLLPLVYDELKRLAMARLANEGAGNSLHATALVHEAYLRLVDRPDPQSWDGRGHFFAAAAEAMRRILVEQARRKKRLKRGGDRRRVDLLDHQLSIDQHDEELLAIDDVLQRLRAEDPQAAAILDLKYFAGLSVEEAAAAAGISRATAYRQWTYARAWIRAELLD